MIVLIEDTRNQIDKHNLLNEQLKNMGYKVIRSKLVAGDYTLLENQKICIDTKKDIVELCGNICGSQHERVREEIVRANECGIQLIFLIEEVPPENDLSKWQSPKHKNGKPLTQVKGETLLKAIKTMKAKYGCRFVFCNKENTAKHLVRLLMETGETNGR